MSDTMFHLDLVAVHFSTRCESACSFCYAADPLAVRAPPTPLETVKRILDKLALDGVKEILFVGGDPVVHPHFLASLRHAKQLRLTTSVLSNSWSLRPKERHDEILSLIDFVDATVLGSTAVTHDRITGRQGSFERLTANLKGISDTGKAIGLCINAMPENLTEVYDIVKTFTNDMHIPLRGLMIQRIIPSGSATGQFKFGLNLDDVELLMTQIHRVATEFSIPIQFEDPVPWCTVNPEYHSYLSRCEWGYTRGAVNAEGYLNRCAADDHYRLGTIFDSNVQDLWNSHPILRSFRSKNYLPSECKQCPDLDRCGGGCSLSCGTFQDHDVDQLYAQKTQRSVTGHYTANAPSGVGFERMAVRFAYDGDLDQITNLETVIFGDSFPVFHSKNIRDYFALCPRAFRVATVGSQVVGYSIVFPLNQNGVDEINASTPESVVRMNPAGINGRFSSLDKALYVEVIAVSDAAPLAARIGLLKDLRKQLTKSSLPAYTCPITEIGTSMAERLGFIDMPRSNTEHRSLMIRLPVLGQDKQEAVHRVIA